MTFAVRTITPVGSGGGGGGTLFHVYRSGNGLIEIIPSGYAKLVIEAFGTGGTGGGGNGGGGGGYVRSPVIDISAAAGLTMVVDIDLTGVPPANLVFCRARAGTLSSTGFTADLSGIVTADSYTYNLDYWIVP